MKNKDKEASCPTKKTSIGGQALLEGIMMRGPKKTALAVRRPDGEMVLEVTPTASAKRKGFPTWPVIRGVVSFVDSMMSGYSSMMRSAELSGFDEMLEKEEREKAAKKAAKKSKKQVITEDTHVDVAAGNSAEVPSVTMAETPSEGETVVQHLAAEDPIETKENTADKSFDGSGDETIAPLPKEEKNSKTDNKPQESASGSMMGIMVVALILGLGLALLLFKVIPESVYELLTKAVPSMVGTTYWHNLLRAAVVGVVKIAILVGYMAAVALMKDIRRTFMYHGAEHKTIFCYENGLDLTVENVRTQRRFHPRCGTSFLILTLLVSIVVNMFIPATIVATSSVLNVIARSAIGLLCLPFIMGFGYELIRLAGRHDNLFTRIISAPGVWLQHITTREPDDSMIECAIAALEKVIPSDNSDNW